jgi:hypothetical protein
MEIEQFGAVLFVFPPWIGLFLREDVDDSSLLFELEESALAFGQAVPIEELLVLAHETVVQISDGFESFAFVSFHFLFVVIQEHLLLFPEFVIDEELPSDCFTELLFVGLEEVLP